MSPPPESTVRLLAWYEQNRRDLPWRGRTDPYEIWVSEIMLQQTRSETVVRYYDDFLDRFPRLAELAAATEDEVLSAWSGMGYYRRARQLHRAARMVVDSGGELPSSVDELRSLPGIGPYTAAAIASLAFGVPEPVVDGNVERVLSRYRAIEDSPKSAIGRRRLQRLAGSMLDKERPGDFNQALMELGALVCSPRRPDCDRCPLQAGCVALASGSISMFPPPSPRRPASRERWVAAVVRRHGSLLLAKKPSSARVLAGLWDLPAVEIDRSSTGDAHERALGERYGGTWRLEPSAGRVRHSITTRRLEVSVHPATLDSPEVDRLAVAEAGEVAEDSSQEVLCWVPEADLGTVPSSSLLDKALAALE